MGYNASEIDPVELITGIPGISTKSAYPGNPQIAANYGAQTYPGQAFDNIQKMTSGAGNAGNSGGGFSGGGFGGRGGSSGGAAASGETWQDVRDDYH